MLAKLSSVTAVDRNFQLDLLGSTDMLLLAGTLAAAAAAAQLAPTPRIGCSGTQIQPVVAPDRCHHTRLDMNSHGSSRGEPV